MLWRHPSFSCCWVCQSFRWPSFELDAVCVSRQILSSRSRRRLKSRAAVNIVILTAAHKPFLLQDECLGFYQIKLHVCSVLVLIPPQTEKLIAEKTTNWEFEISNPSNCRSIDHGDRGRGETGEERSRSASKGREWEESGKEEGLPFPLFWGRFAFLPFSSYFFSKAEPALDEDGNPVVKKGRGRPPGSGNKKAAKKAAKTAKGVRRRLVLFHIMSSYLPASFNRNYQNLLSEWKRSW